MKLDPAVFYDMSLKEWMLAQQGFFDIEEVKMQRAWEIARWQSYIGALPYAKQGKLTSPTSLVKFPWEKGREVEADVYSPEEEDYFIRKFGKFSDKDGKFFNA